MTRSKNKEWSRSGESGVASSAHGPFQGPVLTKTRPGTLLAKTNLSGCHSRGPPAEPRSHIDGCRPAMAGSCAWHGRPLLPTLGTSSKTRHWSWTLIWYCCLPNFGRCGRSQERLSVNCPLVQRLYPAEWMAEKLFRTVDHPSWHRRHRPKLGRQQ